jgi:hypothetical protein
MPHFRKLAPKNAKILQSGSSEKKSVNALLQCRAVQDLRRQRLADARKKVAFQSDTIALDHGAVLRKAFANFAHALLAQKEREMAELLNDLLPADSLPGINNRDLVYACALVVRRRQKR